MEEKNSKGYIYEIKNIVNNCVYIGSTKKSIEERFNKHKMNAKTDKRKHLPLYKDINEYGFENFEISILEEFNDIDIFSLRKREGYYQRQKELKYNLVIAGRTDEEYTIENKEKIKKYYQESKEYFLEKAKIRYQENKENILKNVKEYSNKNKEKIKKYQEEYRIKNKEKLLEYSKKVYICPCSPEKELTVSKKSRHEQTVKHQKYLQSLEETKE